MKVCADCIPCYLKQALNTLNQTELGDDQKAKLLNKVLPSIAELAQDKTPAENSSKILHKICMELGVQDPFQRAKKESNQAVMKLWPKLQQVLAESDDKLFTAFKLAVAGNVIDLGILADYNIEQSITEALQVDFAINDYDVLKEKLEKAQRVLIIGDNSGEIAFDKLLAVELASRGLQLTFGVKGAPILNDATMKDAEEVGMEKVARVITNGNSYLGTVVEYCSPEFLSAMAGADVIISKGQANYESLEGTKEAGVNTFFILRAKCDVVAANLGVKLGEIVLKQNKANKL